MKQGWNTIIRCPFRYMISTFSISTYITSSDTKTEIGIWHIRHLCRFHERSPYVKSKTRNIEEAFKMKGNPNQYVQTAVCVLCCQFKWQSIRFWEVNYVKIMSFHDIFTKNNIFLTIKIMSLISEFILDN